MICTWSPTVMSVRSLEDPSIRILALRIMPDLPTASTRAAETVGLPTFHGIYALTSSFWHTNTGRAHGQWKLAGMGSSNPLCFGGWEVAMVTEPVQHAVRRVDDADQPTATLGDVDISSELWTRSVRRPDYERENRAF